MPIYTQNAILDTKNQICFEKRAFGVSDIRKTLPSQLALGKENVSYENGRSKPHKIGK